MCHRVEAVDDGDDPRSDRDRFSCEAGWVAVAVSSFVVGQRDLLGQLEDLAVASGEQSRAEGRVLLHDRDLFRS